MIQLAPRGSHAATPVRTARELARELLAQLGGPELLAPLEADDRHPALLWADCGAMALTGESDGPPLLAPGSLAGTARAALCIVRALAGPQWRGPQDGAALLGERAALLGLRRRGRVSAGGSARLLRSGDGWLALNLARADDRALLPAWLETGSADLAWSAIARALRERLTGEWIERARLLGLPAAPADPPPDPPPPAVRIARRGPKLERSPGDLPFVLDLSSLWAGPLCASLLQAAGSRVVKLESTRRPDGSRAGPAAFFDLLHAGQPSVALDLASAEGRAALARLVERADLVVESSRPRALRQLGIDAEAWIDAQPGRVWVALSGYGRASPADAWVALGDDAAVAAGLAAALAGRDGVPLFCADAIADPLAGLLAAAASLAAWRSGESRLIDVSLREAAAAALGPAAIDGARLLGDPQGWSVEVDGERARVRAPRAREARGRARPLGADTHEVLAGC